VGHNCYQENWFGTSNFRRVSISPHECADVGTKPILRNQGGSKWKFYGANSASLLAHLSVAGLSRRKPAKPIYSSTDNNLLTAKEFDDI
jgi:hypothetical protein